MSRRYFAVLYYVGLALTTVAVFNMDGWPAWGLVGVAWMAVGAYRKHDVE